jgi:hypothetical protein
MTGAVAAGGISFNAARAVGPALGGIVVAYAGVGITFALNAASFLAVMAVLYQWNRAPSVSVMPAERILAAIRAGWRYTRHAPHLQAVLVRTAAFVVGSSALWAVLPLLAQRSLRLNAAGYGGLLACFGVGAMTSGALLPSLGRRYSRNTIAGGAAAGFAAVSAAVAVVRILPLEFVLMACLGGCWTLTLTTFNIAAQLSVPIWVQGRALAMYQVMVQGGIAGGSVVWGYVAQRSSVPEALLIAALATAASLLTMLGYKLAGDGDLDLSPLTLPAPVTVGEIDPDSGPVLVTIEYLIDPRRAVQFADAMRSVRGLRLRDGAVFWGLFFDAAQKGRIIEYFVVESWIEHLRQHERAVGADAETLAVARAFHIAPHPPVTSHQISTLRADSLARFQQSEST